MSVCLRACILAMCPCGEVAERLNAPVLKTGIRFGESWVRIPPSPLPQPAKRAAAILLFSYSSDIRPMRFLLLISTLLGACTASQPLPMTVQVRDSTTHAPVAHALVASIGLSLYIPISQNTQWLSSGAIVGPPANPARAKASTDIQGSAAIMLAGNRPNQVYISADGYQPLKLIAHTSANAIQQPKDWTRGTHIPSNAIESKAPTLEARFVDRH